MKTKLCICLLLLCSLGASAQQRPYYTQYILNDFIINPAFAGIENYWDAKASYRAQWVGLQGAPVTTYFTIQGPLEKSDFDRETPVTVHPSDDNPRGASYFADYKAAEPHFGLGFTVINDVTGPLNNFQANATLAYHMPIGQQTTISGAFSFGMQNMRLDATALNFGTQNPVDPAVAGSGYLNKIKPDMNAGVLIYSSNYFIGLAAQQIIPEQIGYGNEKTSGDTVVVLNGKLIPHLFMQFGYRFLLSDDINFLPSVTLKYISPLPVSMDINAKFQYRDILWVGGSYRPNNGFAAMLGVNISSLINIGYSYDLTTSQLNTVSYGTHEILVGFLIGNKYGDWCPRNVY